MTIMEKIEANRASFNPRYDMRLFEAGEIRDTSGGILSAIYVAFNYGYIKGMRAAKAEQRKAAKA